MPATFESFGIRFLYPENWTVLDRSEDEGDDGVTLEMPSGGFMAIEQRQFIGAEFGPKFGGAFAAGVPTDDDFIEEIAQTTAAEYEEAEREEVQIPDAAEGERAVDLRFYYLDLLIVSRIIVMPMPTGRLLIQIQAESRDFDANEMVFAAILKQIRDTIG